MFKRLQFTFPEGASSISCADQKLATLQAKMDGTKTHFLKESHNITGRIPLVVIPLLANQKLTPMLWFGSTVLCMHLLHISSVFVLVVT